MGIDLWNLQFLLKAYTTCGAFGDTVQIGRQEIHIGPGGYAFADELFRRYGLDMSFEKARQGGRYADQGLLQTLGATNVVSADASGYEGAAIVHDFNDPIDPQYHQKFDTVLDGGSLEHIFNVPTALANEMNLTKVGGRILSTLPANNWLGHGFYQFSQELPFQVFTPNNGFAARAVLLSAINDDENFVELEHLARRSGGEICRTRTNTYLLFIAEKLEHVPLFRRWPQQGDYQSQWEQHGYAPIDRDAQALAK